MHEKSPKKLQLLIKNLIHPFNLTRTMRFVYLICLNLVLKLTLIFVRIFPDDVDFYRFTGTLFLRGIIPYSDFILPGSHIVDVDLYFNTMHPNGPLNYIFYGFWMRLFGADVWAIKLPWLISEIVIVIMIYLIAEVIMDSNKAFLSAIFYTIMPASYYPGIFVGCDELITSAFTVGAVYCFFKQKYSLSAILLALGTSYKLFPLFGLIPVFYYFWTKRDLKQLVSYVILFALSWFIIALPFLMLDFESFVYWNFSQANRTITIPYFYKQRDVAFFSPIFSIFMVPISPYTFYQLILMAIIVLPRFIPIFTHKIPEYTNQDFLRDFSVIIVMLPILSFSNNYRYFFWALPFLILYLMSKWNLGVPSQNFEPLINIQILILLVFTMVILVVSYIIESCYILFSVQCYNIYIFTFVLVYGFYAMPLLFTLGDRRINRKYLIFTFLCIISGISSLFLYEYWESIQYHDEQPIYQWMSIFLLLISLAGILMLLFEDKMKKIHIFKRIK